MDTSSIMSKHEPTTKAYVQFTLIILTTILVAMSMLGIVLSAIYLHYFFELDLENETALHVAFIVLNLGLFVFSMFAYLAVWTENINHKKKFAIASAVISSFAFIFGLSILISTSTGSYSSQIETQLRRAHEKVYGNVTNEGAYTSFIGYGNELNDSTISNRSSVYWEPWMRLQNKLDCCRLFGHGSDTDLCLTTSVGCLFAAREATRLARVIITSDCFTWFITLLALTSAYLTLGDGQQRDTASIKLTSSGVDSSPSPPLNLGSPTKKSIKQPDEKLMQDEQQLGHSMSQLTAIETIKSDPDAKS